jgi:glycosyltransferase involved in cell wall biosynthesis
VHTPILSNLLRVRTEDLAAASRVIVPSEWSRAWTLQNIGGAYDQSGVQVVPNIIDRRIFRTREASPKRDRPLLLWVGKMAHYKRWQDAVRIMGALNAVIPADFCFATGGHCSPNDTEAFLHEMSECGLTGPVRWIHNAPIDHMAELYADAAASGGLLLSTSEAESFCLGVHEAMSCGAPVVAARAGAIAELLVDGLDGLTFEVGDIGAAVRVAAEVLGDPQVRQSAVRGGLRRQRDFDSAELEQLYLRTIEDVHQAT